MEAYIYWFVLAFIFLVVEMSTGTFYFLALSIAMALGGLAAQVGLGLELQLPYRACLRWSAPWACAISKNRGVPRRTSGWTSARRSGC